ncbi:MAG: hypothetical protein IKN55_02795, partial [Oscillospiraceae bacterium]|nr:hypothetical protein [Oscillospiraceae bacterium]
MITVNTLFRLVVLAKRQGKGRIGNGAILTELLGTISDLGDDFVEIQRRLVISPDNVNANRYADRLMKHQVHIPAADAVFGIPLTQFQALVNAPSPDAAVYLYYLERMHRFCVHTLDEAKFPALTAALLCHLRADQTVHSVYYHNRFLPKDALSGTPAHPKRICIEALLVGLLYHALRCGNAEDAHLLTLPPAQKIPSFCVISLDDAAPLSPAQLDAWLDLTQPVSMAERLQQRAPERSDAAFLYPSEACIGQQIVPADSALDAQENLFLSADGAMGKTTLLRRIKGLYLPLYRYKQEIREHLLPDGSCYLLTQILLHEYYGGEYTSWEGCAACETEAVSAFQELVRLLSQPEFCLTLLLDGTNEIASEQLGAFAEEVAWLMQHCPALRFVVSGRTVPDYAIFREFTPVQLLGIPEPVRDEALAALPAPPTDQNLLELLRSPMFLKLYLDERGEGIRTRGEILDAYFCGWKSPVSDDSKLLLFAVRYVLPFAANTMLHHHRALSRADLLDALDSAKTLYLGNERIYQNCIAVQHFRRTDLLNAMQNADLASLLIDHTGLLSHDADGLLRFTHQYYRDYFAAKYILNVTEALVRGFGDRFPEEKGRIFAEYGLGEIWFTGDDSGEIYRLIGEISGDYRNIPDETGLDYQETLLDDLLDNAREIPHFRMVENVMTVMHQSRNGLVCGVDFSGLQLPFNMPEGTYFSQNGLYPCDFRNAKVLGVFASSIPEDGDAEQTVYPPE